MKKIIFTLLILGLAQLLVAQPLVTNGNFESWTAGAPDGWTLMPDGTDISFAQASALGFTGDALQIIANANGSGYDGSFLTSTYVTGIVAGNTYDLKIKVKSADDGVLIRFWDTRWYDNSNVQVGVDIDDNGYSPITGGAWTDYQAAGTIHTAPAGATQLLVGFRVYVQAGFVAGVSNVLVDNLTVTDVTSSPANIINAYAVSSTGIDLFYDKNITSVDAGDYYLTGTNYVSFSQATIDGSDASIVHLTGASPAMVGDITLDEIFDDGNGTSFQFYAGILPISYTNTTNPSGTMLNAISATFRGIVSANDGNNNVWVSDATGAHHGILIFNSSFDALAAVGDDIIFVAERSPYSNLSELINPILISTVTTGNSPYGPTDITGDQIDYMLGADTDPGEKWEGQLVRISDFTVDSLSVFGTNNYACSWSDGGPTYTFYVGDNAGTFSLSIGATYASITGVVDWYWTGNFYRINPRNQGDIIGSALPAIKLAITSVNGGVDPYVSIDFDVVVEAQDNLGNPAAVSGDVNFTFTTDGGTGGNVSFVSGTSYTGTILDGTSQITVNGVQMAPAGSNVTITASDDASGLTAGISAAFDVVELTIPDLIITEIMQNPSAVLDSDGEWFEIYNNTSNPVDLNGWVIKDDGTDSTSISSSVVVPAYGFVVLGNKSDALINGGYACNYQYSSFTLGNSDDEIVLCLSDGLTEVDRVEYDGGPVWPDPAGASMSYTGFYNEDNNDGTKWVWATFRENSYDNTKTDRGSPGSNGYDQIVTGGFKLDLKVYLESPFVNADSMSNYFRANGMLPYVHPFNPALPYYGNNSPKWLFAGYDTITFVPLLTADWVLVELRDAVSAASATSATTVAKYPALVSETGNVVSMNGYDPLNVDVSFTNNMYVVIYNPNHLAIMSSTGIIPFDATVVAYDFSTGAGQVYGGAAAYKELQTGVWGMMSGDVNGDKMINATDMVDGWGSEAGEAGAYQGSNLYIDDQINNLDKNEKWVPNNGKSSQVPN